MIRWSLRCLIAALISIAVSCSAADGQKLNVLLLVSDDLCTHLSAYGDPLVKTPNVDRLAARGVRFAHAYCQYPLCNPSRASFLTGLRPDSTRVYDNAIQFRKNVPDAVTIGQTFQKGGYFVARVGKLYHYGVPAEIGTNGLDDPPSWAERYNPKGRDIDDYNMIERITLLPDGKAGWEHATAKEQIPALKQFGATLSRLKAEGDDEEQTDGKIANETIKLLETHKDGPFFLACGFFRPHTPYVSPKKYYDMYPLDKIQLPTVPEGYRATVPAPAFTFKKEEEAMTDTQRKDAIQAYFAATSFMDAQLGRVLDALDRLKLADKTVIVFISDHGYHLYEHQLWQKMTIFENAAHVPMIICAPGIPAGKVSSRIVELVDLHPTLADLAGVTPPAKLDGVSIRPLVENPDAAWDKPALTQVQRARPKAPAGEEQKKGPIMGYSLRTEKWRYTEWGGGEYGTELYDEEKDQNELKNLAKDAEYKETVAKLKEELGKMTAKKE
ncbi:MAG TPA: sulfatase [Planctomycetota bacterium]|nr:sulfatase [Planctomycetota bacterium]